MPHCAAGSPECSSLSEPSPGRSCPASRPRRSLLPLLCGVVIVLTTMAGEAKALPAGPKPRWVNPCELPGHVFDPSTDMEGAPPIRAAEIFRNVRDRAFVAKKHAEDVTKKFVSTCEIFLSSLPSIFCMLQCSDRIAFSSVFTFGIIAATEGWVSVSQIITYMRLSTFWGEISVQVLEYVALCFMALSRSNCDRDPICPNFCFAAVLHSKNWIWDAGSNIFSISRTI